MGLGSDYLPLPADTPHCASYNTHHDRIFAQGGPAEARELDALLPLRYAELQSAAADVKNSEKYLDSFASGRGTQPMALMLWNYWRCIDERSCKSRATTTGGFRDTLSWHRPARLAPCG